MQFLSLHTTRLLAVLLASAVSTIAVADDEWPQFRGPDGQGHTNSTSLPLKWSETENVVWKTAIPGEGHSSPVISGNQIWLTTAIVEKLSEEETQKRLATIKNPQGLQLAGTLRLQGICVNRETGAIQHSITLFSIETPEPRHALNSYASPTPVISGGQVFFHFGTYGTAAVNRETAQVVWKNDSLKLDHQNGPAARQSFGKTSSSFTSMAPTPSPSWHSKRPAAKLHGKQNDRVRWIRLPSCRKPMELRCSWNSPTDRC